MPLILRHHNAKGFLTISFEGDTSSGYTRSPHSLLGARPKPALGRTRLAARKQTHILVKPLRTALKMILSQIFSSITLLWTTPERALGSSALPSRSAGIHEKYCNFNFIASRQLSGHRRSIFTYCNNIKEVSSVMNYTLTASCIFDMESIYKICNGHNLKPYRTGFLLNIL